MLLLEMSFVHDIGPFLPILGMTPNARVRLYRLIFGPSQLMPISYIVPCGGALLLLLLLLLLYGGMTP